MWYRDELDFITALTPILMNLTIMDVKLVKLYMYIYVEVYRKSYTEN